jgi:serine/threonine-protein kinase
MGEVYRARDSRLNRDVAIKILPEAFAADAERLARFQREAQVLAALNHPGIAAIYGFEESDGVRGLVLELVEGETLADRIARGPLPLDEALGVAREIAAALETAHERGIVHRDLKPANVKLTPAGKVKVLDFGLAKALTGDGSSPDVTSSPTMTAAATQAGVVIGTAAYMSPEQARGKSVDRRADIWAFGVVLYEMLVGRKAFEGETVSDTLAAVLRSEPDWSRLPQSTPGHVRRTLRRCLERDRERRLRDIGDARLELEGDGGAVADSFTGVAAAPPRRGGRSQWLPWVLAVLSAGVAGLLALRSARARPEAPRPPRLFSISGVPVAFDQRQSLAISPDGTQVVYRGRSDEGEERLYIREPGALLPRAIPGTDGGGSPFFSPDGRSIAFVIADAMKRVDLSGGTPQTIGDIGQGFFGGVWDEDGSILFSSVITEGSIVRLPAGGGKPEVVVAVDPARDEDRFFTPWPLPGGKGLLFTSRRVGQNSSQLRVEALSLPDGERHTIAEDGASPIYRDGVLFFQQGAIVMAVPFDVSTMRAIGTPAPVLDSVRPRISGSVRNFNVSENGTLVYMPAPNTEGARLVWLDRKGVETPIATIGNVADSPRLSPEGQRVLFRMPAPNCDVWMHDIARGSTSRVTTEGDNHGAIWTPDGRRILFARVRANQADLLSVDSGGGSPEKLFSGQLANAWVSSCSPDGRRVAVSSGGPQTSGDIVLIEDGKARNAVASRFQDDAGAISPDGRHIAYVSNESGRPEVYVQPLTGGGERIQVSGEGGREPVWSRDGREIFFRHGRHMLAATVEGSSPFRTGRPHVLFEHDLTFMTLGPVANYDVSRDDRFLMIRTTGSTATESYVVLDWLPEVKRKLPGAQR